MSLKSEIEEWDGKSAEAITAVYNRHSDRASFVSEILSLMELSSCQKGSSWLLKRHFEDKGRLEPGSIEFVYGLLPKLEHWETKLHILQCIPYMPIAPEEMKAIEAFLRSCLADPRKFVRAWAYNGFYQLSLQHQDYQEEAKRLLAKALKEEAASVKARIRNIAKKGFR